MSQPIALFGLKLKPGEVHRIPMVFRDFKITNVSFAGDDVKGNKRSVVKVHHIPHYGHLAVEEEDLADEMDSEDDDDDEDEEVEIADPEDDDDEEEDDGEEDEDEDDDDDEDDIEIEDAEDDDEEEDSELDSDEEDARDAALAEKQYTERVFTLCSLTPGKIEQVSVDIAFTEDEDIAFSVTGDNEVDIIGNYTAPVGADQPPYSDEEEDSDLDDEYDSDDDDEYDVEYDSDGEPIGRYLNDSEIDSDDIDSEDDDDEYDSDEEAVDGLDDILAEGDSEEEDSADESAERFEEVASTVPASSAKASLKRKAATDAADEMDVSGISASGPVTDSELAQVAAAEGLDVSKLSKSQRKRLNKKLKTASGALDAADVPSTTKEAVEATIVDDGKAKTAAKATTEKAGKETSSKQKLPSGLVIETKKQGSGTPAKKGEKIGMRYIGKLQSNGKVFDSNTKGKPFSFKLGKGEVIKAWDQGVLGMKIGEERRLTCPPATAYGSQGAPPDIPRNATLVFDVKRTQ